MQEDYFTGEAKYREKTNVDLYDRQYCYISNLIVVVTTDTSDINSPIIASFNMLFVLMFIIITFP